MPPPPPPGFTLDAPSPPPGFRLDGAPAPTLAPAQPAQPNTLADVARSTWGGLVQGLAGLRDMTDPATAMAGAASWGAKVAGNPKLAAFFQKVAPSATSQIGAVGGNYRPQTTAGRYAQSIASMAPNAVLGPEGLVPRIAATVLPGVASQGAADLAQAAGGGPLIQGAARFVGGLAGGLGAGIGGARVLPPAPQVLSDAEKPVAHELQIALDATGAHRDDVKAALSTGQLPITTTPGLTQLADSVAQQPGAGQVLIRDAVGSRFASQTDRTLQAVQSHLGVDPTAARGNIDQIVQQGRQAADPIYKGLRASPAPVWNADLAALAQRPAIKKAIGIVANNKLNAGESPSAAGFKIDPDTGNWVLPDNGSLVGSLEQQPTASTWIDVHQMLGNTVERNPFTHAPLPDSEAPGNFGIRTASGDLKTALTQAIPGYDQALATSGDYLSTKGAFDRAGGKLFNGPVAKFQDMWSSLQNPSEVQAARASIANDILTKSEGSSFTPGTFSRSPGIQQKLQIAFGPAADNFVTQMEGDLAERNALGKIVSGSPTELRQAMTRARIAAQPQPNPVMQGLQKATSAVNTVASFLHPVTAVTKMADIATHAGSKPSALPAPAYEIDPQVNAQLGQLLTNPQAMTGFLDRMAAQKALDWRQARLPARVAGLLNGPAVAAPGLLSGLAAPSQAQASPGGPPQ